MIFHSNFPNMKGPFKALLILLGILFITYQSQAQELRNIWLGGPSTNNGAGVYGTKGVADPANIPPARSNGMSWVSDGNFYLFGGLDDNGGDYFNDFWKWDGTNWTYLGGAQGPVNDAGSGTLGQADPNNIPSARDGSATWVDKNGNLYLFSGRTKRDVSAGVQIGYSNQTWKWNGSSWILVSGDDLLGTSSSSNFPGSSKNATACYDGGKYVYLFGGDNGSLTYSSSLYRLDLDSLSWSLLKNNSEKFGTKLVESSTNNPPPLAYSAAWYDERNDCLMLNGGFVLELSQSGVRYGTSNAIWKLDLSTNNWTWVYGDSTLDQSVVYSNADPSLINPGGRHESTVFKDGAGMVYLFGGRSVNAALYHDLWRWDNTKWEYLGGSQSINSNGNFASSGYSSSNSIPSRSLAMNFFYKNELYVFGGRRFGTTEASNDFWKMEYGYFYEDQGSGASWFPNSPSDSANVYIREDFPPSAQGAFSFTGKNLFIESGSELELEKRSESDFDAFSLSGDLVLDGSLIGEGLLKFTGEGIHEIIGSQDLEYFGVISLDSNAVLKTNNKLTLGATANSLGQLVYSNGENEVLDSITMETWLDLQGTTDNARYFYLNSPLEGVSYADFGNGAYLNFDTDPNLSSAYAYDVNIGWFAIPIAYATVPLKYPAAFYAGQKGDTTFLKPGGEAGTISIKGVSGKNSGSGFGSTPSLVYNNGQSNPSNFIGSGSLTETEGWNLIPNVFPSYFDLKESFDSSQHVRKTAYVWNGVDYSSYTENGSGTGLTTNGGDRYLKPFVPYFVQVENVSSSSISIGRHVSSGVGFKTYSTSAKKGQKSDAVHIFLKNQLGENENDAWVGFNSSASSGFEGGMDAWKIFGNPEKAALYSRSSNLNFAVNILSSEEEIHEIPVFVDFDTAHGQNLSLDFELGELETYNSLWLEDMALSKFTDLSHSPHYNFTYDSTALSPRFRLHFSRKHIDLEEEEIGFYSYKDENGQFQLVFGEEQNNSQIRIYDASGKLVEELEFSGSRIKLSPLAAKGLYIIQLEGQAGVFSQKIMN